MHVLMTTTHIVTVEGGSLAYRSGSTYLLPSADAEEFIRLGVAIDPSAHPEPEPQPVPAEAASSHEEVTN